MNNKNEQETLSSGGPCFKPIKPTDLNTIRKHGLDHKISDDSKKTQETNLSSDLCDEDSSSQVIKKCKLTWTTDLENQFDKAVQHLGVHKATPKKILAFMNLKFLTKAHISSKLQKYRKNLKVKEENMKRERIAKYPKISSAGGYNPQHSYSYNTRLGNNNLFNFQPGYGLDRSSSMMNKKAGLYDSLNYMNCRPAYDLSQNGSKLFPRRGNLGFQNGMLPIKEEWRSIPRTSQAPRFGQYGTTSNVAGMNYNPTTDTMGSNNARTRRDENGDLVGLGGIRANGNGSFSGIRVHGTGSGSLQGMNVHCNDHRSLGGIRGQGKGSHEGIRVHGNVHGSLGGMRVDGSDNGIRVHSNSNINDSLGGIRVHGNVHGSLGGMRVDGSDNGIRVHSNSNSNDSLGGIRVHGTGSVGGINVHGTGNSNGSLGENVGMNWNFSNNMSNHGSSTPKFPSALSRFLDNKDQSQNNLITQPGGVIPALENPKLFNDHHDINEGFPDTNISQFHQNQHQGNLIGENREAPTAYPLEDVSSWIFNDGTNNEEILNSLTANPEIYFPTQDMNITNQGNNHEEILNSLAANPEMYFPTQEMNITNQDYDDEDFLKYLIDPDMN